MSKKTSLKPSPISKVDVIAPPIAERPEELTGYKIRVKRGDKHTEIDIAYAAHNEVVTFVESRLNFSKGEIIRAMLALVDFARMTLPQELRGTWDENL